MPRHVGEGPPTRLYVEQTPQGLRCGMAENGAWEDIEFRLLRAGTLVNSLIAESREVARMITQRFDPNGPETQFRELMREVPAELEAR